ncbi:hypothetical protein FBEOM_1680 [Fusarium beomiforme]|uniref:Hsp70 protein n=1 Tax=Fusarium beomiforme TaxID=44412 RepID=A0A9P5ASQ9_9HYPO|nr:hypothetical protein FBEOM_1680 [Fusarium beomiforme]
MLCSHALSLHVSFFTQVTYLPTYLKVLFNLQIRQKTHFTIASGLVIGIDVGMSGTRVAYRSRGDDKVKTLLWGTISSEEKIPTKLFYNIHQHSSQLVGWGFDPPEVPSGTLEVQEWFKTDLGRDGVDQNKVKSLYKDYLTCLYEELSLRRFTPAMLGGIQFQKAIIRFLFSVPSTWSPDVVDTFALLVSDAGFGKIDSHTVGVSMTEPQAVAAFEICDKESSCRLQVDDHRGRSQATELKPVIGFNIGSAKIDQGFEAFAIGHLGNMQSFLEKDIKFVARSMSNSDSFQKYMKRFNTVDFDSSIGKVPFTKSCEDGTTPTLSEMAVHFTEDDMTRLFDEQIELMWERIRYYPDCLETVTPTDPATDLNYIILAGGLGSSSYVLSRLEELLAMTQSHLSNSTKLVKSRNARLAVCMGLVYYAGRIPDVFPQRLHRASFGIAAQAMAHEKSRFRDSLKRMLSNQSKGKGKESQVDWFVIKTATFDPEIQRTKRIWRVAIMSSSESDPLRLKSKGKVLERSHLLLLKQPAYINRYLFVDGRRHHRTIEVDLSRAPEVGKRESLARLHLAKKPNLKVDFIIEAHVTHTTVVFQCFDKNGNSAGESTRVSMESMDHDLDTSVAFPSQ